jgi:hypothetical protein
MYRSQRVTDVADELDWLEDLVDDAINEDRLVDLAGPPFPPPRPPFPPQPGPSSSVLLVRARDHLNEALRHMHTRTVYVPFYSNLGRAESLISRIMVNLRERMTSNVPTNQIRLISWLVNVLNTVRLTIRRARQEAPHIGMMISPVRIDRIRRDLRGTLDVISNLLTRYRQHF